MIKIARIYSSMSHLFLLYLYILSLTKADHEAPSVKLEAIDRRDNPYCVLKYTVPQDAAERRQYVLEKRLQRCKIELKDTTSKATAVYEMNSVAVPLLRSLHATIYSSSLDQGSSAGVASAAYASSLNDVFNGIPMENLGTGMALGKSLGGQGQNLANIFPQSSLVQASEWASVENQIYTCLKENPTCVAHISQRYHYDKVQLSRPFTIDYHCHFVCESGNGCDAVETTMRN